MQVDGFQLDDFATVGDARQMLGDSPQRAWANIVVPKIQPANTGEKSGIEQGPYTFFPNTVTGDIQAF